MDEQLRFGVRVDRAGIVATDYHTVTGYHRTAAGGFKHSGGTAKTLKTALEHGPATIVSPRDYLHDAVFLVAFGGPADLIGDCRARLSDPVWPLYLGRKSCPATRPFLALKAQSYVEVEAALAEFPRHKEAASGRLTAYVEDPQGSLERQDALRVNPLRMYEFRSCRYLEVDPPCTSPE
jgi:CRISPR system Cascade subunit CasD